MRIVLHIEPSEFVSKVVESIIKDRGYEYIWTTSYSDALVTLEEYDVDMIFVSLIGDGMAIDDFIKNVNYINSDIPICVVSSNKFDGTIQRVLNLGARQYIDKHNIESEMVDYIDNYFINDRYMENMRDISIAVVDDCPFARMTLKDIFNKYGLKNVKYFASGAELQHSNIKYDVYLIDIFLKDEFGKNIISQLREERGNSVLLLAVTALENSNILAEIIDRGADDIIPKPIVETLFMSKLKSYTRKLLACKNRTCM